MKKTIILMLTVCMLLTCFAACKKDNTTSGSDIPDEPSTSPTSVTPDVSVPIEEENDLTRQDAIKYGEEKEFTLNIEGTEETVTMTEVTIPRILSSDVNLKMYIDLERYDIYFFEGEVNIVPEDTLGGDPLASIHIFATPEKQTYEGLESFEGVVPFEEFLLSSSGWFGNRIYEMVLDDAYVYISANAIEEAVEGHGARLDLMLRTITQ